MTLKKIKVGKTETISSKKVKISWKKLSKKERKAAKMIEIQVSRDKSFTKDVIVKKVKSSKTSVSVSGLERGKYYFVRIRVYTENGNILNVSDWSKVKSFRIISIFK